MESDLCAQEDFYRPRAPQKTRLYQLLDCRFDAFKSAYEERFERRYGPWRTLWEAAGGGTPDVIDRILRHIEKKGRAPPEGEAAA